MAATALYVAVPPPCAAAKFSAGQTLTQMITSAQRDNKELLAARYAVDIGRAKLLQAGLLPNPRVTIGGASDFAFRDEGAYGAAVGVSQDFPMAGRILRQQDVARVDVALAQAEVADAERRIAGEVAGSVYRILIVGRQIETHDGLIAIDQRLGRATRSRFKSAEVSELDVNAVSLDLQRLTQERARLQAQHETLRIELNLTLGRAAASALNLAQIPLAAEPLAGAVDPDAALARRPDFTMAALQVDRARAEVALANAKRWDDWNIGVGIQQDRQAITGAPRQGNDRALTVTLTIPLALAGRSRGLIAAAAAATEERRARLDALKLAIENQIAAAHAATASLQALLSGYEKEVLPVAERNVALAQKGYGQGLVTILEVVQAQRQFGDLQGAYLATLDQYLQGRVRLHVALSDYPLLDLTDTTSPLHDDAVQQEATQ